jgi:hypothetical protein
MSATAAPWPRGPAGYVAPRWSSSNAAGTWLADSDSRRAAEALAGKLARVLGIESIVPKFGRALPLDVRGAVGPFQRTADRPLAKGRAISETPSVFGDVLGYSCRCASPIEAGFPLTCA